MSHLNNIEQGLRSLNKALEKLMSIQTPIAVVVGLILGSRISWLKPSSTYLFAFLTLVNAMGVSLNDFKAVIKKPKAIGVFALSSYILIPLFVWATSSIAFKGEVEIITGFVLLYCVPTAVVGAVWSSIHHGSTALSVTLIVISTILAPIVTPTTVKLLAHSDIIMDMSGMIRSLIIMVVVPSIIGMLINYTTKGKCNDHVTPCLKPFTKIALFIVIMSTTSKVADRIINEATWAYLPQAIFALIFTSGGFIISFYLSKLFKLSKKESVSVVFGAGLRNISATLVLAIDFFPPMVSIPVIAGIVLQQTTCAVTSHILFRNYKIE